MRGASTTTKAVARRRPGEGRGLPDLELCESGKALELPLLFPVALARRPDAGTASTVTGTRQGRDVEVVSAIFVKAEAGIHLAPGLLQDAFRM